MTGYYYTGETTDGSFDLQGERRRRLGMATGVAMNLEQNDPSDGWNTTAEDHQILKQSEIAIKKQQQQAEAESGKRHLMPSIPVELQRLAKEELCPLKCDLGVNPKIFYLKRRYHIPYEDYKAVLQLFPAIRGTQYEWETVLHLIKQHKAHTNFQEQQKLKQRFWNLLLQYEGQEPARAPAGGIWTQVDHFLHRLQDEIDLLQRQHPFLSQVKQDFDAQKPLRHKKRQQDKLSLKVIGRKR